MNYAPAPLQQTRPRDGNKFIISYYIRIQYLVAFMFPVMLLRFARKPKLNFSSSTLPLASRSVCAPCRNMRINQIDLIKVNDVFLQFPANFQNHSSLLLEHHQSL